MKDFLAVNDVYAETFPSNPPARAAIQVAALPKNADIEIEAVVHLPD
jgi:2-iminobutanoate/2-iminopropanoate deaminase